MVKLAPIVFLEVVGLAKSRAEESSKSSQSGKKMEKNLSHLVYFYLRYSLRVVGLANSGMKET